jgi:hypothetical protein
VAIYAELWNDLAQSYRLYTLALWITRFVFDE